MISEMGAQTSRTDVSMFWHLFPRRGALSGLTRFCGLFGCWCVGNPDCMGLYRRRARRRLVGSGLQCPEPPRRREHRLYAPLGAGASAPAFGGAIASSSRNIPAARPGVVCSVQSPALTPATSARFDSFPRGGSAVARCGGLTRCAGPSGSFSVGSLGVRSFTGGARAADWPDAVCSAQCPRADARTRDGGEYLRILL